MIRAYRYRLYPNTEQKAYFARCFGATRYCYNYCVREYDAACNAGRQLSGYDVASLLREHTKGLAWMADVDYEIKESAPHRFDIALGKFKRHEANRPREHKKDPTKAVSYTTGGVIKVDFKHDLVQLPKIGVVNARLHRTFNGEIMSATIKQTAAGDYYISFYVESREPVIPMKPFAKSKAVGIDLGIRHLVTLSDGSHYEMPDMSRTINRRAFLQRRLKQQHEGSKGYEKTRRQLARLNEHIANIRLNKHYEIANDICSRFNIVCMETLSVEGMRKGVGEKKLARDSGFNRQLAHVGLGQFSEILENKASRTGTHFVRIDRWEPSTKTCNVCGHVNKDIGLGVEEWTCPECGTHHDRDTNAAINIRNKGIEQLPPAEGNAKPANVADISDPRTGKVTDNDVRRPSTQIEEGTAPARLAYPVEYYIKKKALLPENISQSAETLREAYARENSVYGVKEYFRKLLPILRLKNLCLECNIPISNSQYLYSIKGTPEYYKLFHTIKNILPVMIERKEKANLREEQRRERVEQNNKKKEQKQRMEAKLLRASKRRGSKITGMAYYVSSTTIATLAGTTAPLVDYWAKNRTYDNPEQSQFGKIQDIINAYIQVAQMLRKVSLPGNGIEDVKEFLYDVRQLVQFVKICDNLKIYDSSFGNIYALINTPKFACIVDFLNSTLPNMIEGECMQMQTNLNKAKREIKKNNV